MDIRTWGIHTLDDTLFLDKKVIAIGWKEMGNLSHIESNREAYKNKYAEIYPDKSKQHIANCAGLLYRFVYEAQVGDYVIYPSKRNREINIGLIDSDYFYDENEADYVHKRNVKWLKHLSRTSFTQGALYEVGSAITFFSIRNYTDEFLSALEKEFIPKISEEDDDETVAKTAEEIIESTKDFVLKELERHYKGYGMEEFIADLLRAMGYRTEVSPKGGDRGIDIKAYKDELPPRIIVQVKSQNSDINESMIQSLKGTMREGDYGLFITLTNYTKNAKSYLEQTPIIRGINGAELAELILKNYDKLGDKYKKMIPLKMVYIPVVEE